MIKRKVRAGAGAMFPGFNIPSAGMIIIIIPMNPRRLQVFSNGQLVN